MKAERERKKEREWGGGSETSARRLRRLRTLREVEESRPGITILSVSTGPHTRAYAGIT